MNLKLAIALLFALVATAFAQKGSSAARNTAYPAFSPKPIAQQPVREAYIAPAPVKPVTVERRKAQVLLRTGSGFTETGGLAVVAGK